jgi:hypothetical protein
MMSNKSAPSLLRFCAIGASVFSTIQIFSVFDITTQLSMNTDIGSNMIMTTKEVSNSAAFSDEETPLNSTTAAVVESMRNETSQTRTKDNDDGGEIGNQTAIFLNAYIPPTDQYKGKEWETSENVSLGIVSDQLSQIAESYAGSRGVTVYVTTVAKDVLNATRLNDICEKATGGRVKCTHLTHVQKGGELDTLAGLYEYCHTVSPTTRVVYMHNKGSFHPSGKNTNWRRAMTAATVTRDCLKPPDDSCDVCGLQFAAPPKMFGMLMPGNFFSASCQYVNQLHHPKEFKWRMTTMIRKVFMLEKKGRFHFGPKDTQGWVMGSGRYTPEHWIGSHPFIKPCDLSVEERYWYWENHEHSQDEFKWSMYPRIKDEPTVANRQDDSDIRLRKYVFLAGLLYRHIHLYNATPPESSWMYNALPDGAFWRESVKEHGHNVVEVVTGTHFNRTESTIQSTVELSTTVPKKK